MNFLDDKDEEVVLTHASEDTIIIKYRKKPITFIKTRTESTPNFTSDMHFNEKLISGRYINSNNGDTITLSYDGTIRGDLGIFNIPYQNYFLECDFMDGDPVNFNVMYLCKSDGQGNRLFGFELYDDGRRLEIFNKNWEKGNGKDDRRNKFDSTLAVLTRIEKF